MMLAVSTGCSLIHKSYVDPEYGKTNFQDISHRPQPLKWRIVTEWQRNGEHLPSLDQYLKNTVERILKTSGMVEPVTNNDAPTLQVIVNNLGDRGGAFAKGFLSGLTFGLIGVSVTDYYEMKVVLTSGSVVITKTGYKHALHSTSGLIVSSPPGAAPTTASDGINKIIEQMMLSALKDFEKDPQVVSLSSLGFKQPFANLSLLFDEMN
jgi:hypothetical protein